MADEARRIEIGSIVPSTTVKTGVRERVKVSEICDARWRLALCCDADVIVRRGEVAVQIPGRTDFNDPIETTEFGVNLVISGTLQRREDSVRLTLTMIDAVRQRQIDSEPIDWPASKLMKAGPGAPHRVWLSGQLLHVCDRTIRGRRRGAARQRGETVRRAMCSSSDGPLSRG